MATSYQLPWFSLGSPGPWRHLLSLGPVADFARGLFRLLWRRGRRRFALPSFDVNEQKLGEWGNLCEKMVNFLSGRMIMLKYREKFGRMLHYFGKNEEKLKY